MRTAREVRAERARCYDAVNEDNRAADIIKSTLDWVLGEIDTTPYDEWVGEEE
jgi:hypothetical protein